MSEKGRSSFAQARFEEPLLFEMAASSKTTYTETCKTVDALVPPSLCRDRLDLPMLSELEVVRHFTRLSEMNYGVDTGIYPLGSCTMKYNPKICEDMANLPAAKDIHPGQDESTVQGSLQLMFELQDMLSEIGGMKEVSLQPSAGAHGEFTGMLIVKKFHEINGDDGRDQIILPDSAHGTNPASAGMAGFDVVEIASNDEGRVDVEALKDAVSNRTAAFMLTNPNTLGIFEKDVCEIASIIHEAGALLYYDGANLNAIMGICRPGDMGYDIVHFNLHKTFGTPHGGGGPGAGPVGVVENLIDYLPVPVVDRDDTDGTYYLDYDKANTVGKVRSFYGNFGILVRAYTYLRVIGRSGIKDVAQMSVLNSNYMKDRLKEHYPIPDKNLRKHEFVISGDALASKGIKTLDVAKRLLDHGIHPPTIYFPMLVHEAMMIEPTETEPKAELDRLVDALIEISKEDADIIKAAPRNTSVRKLDEAGAARRPILSWMMKRDSA